MVTKNSTNFSLALFLRLRLQLEHSTQFFHCFRSVVSWTNSFFHSSTNSISFCTQWISNSWFITLSSLRPNASCSTNFPLPPSSSRRDRDFQLWCNKSCRFAHNFSTFRTPPKISRHYDHAATIRFFLNLMVQRLPHGPQSQVCWVFQNLIGFEIHFESAKRASQFNFTKISCDHPVMC